MKTTSLTPAARQAFHFASYEAHNYGSGFLGVEHLFLGLLEAGGPDVQRACSGANLDSERLEKLVRAWLRHGSQKLGGSALPATPRLNRIRDRASILAETTGWLQAGPLHLLEAVLSDSRSTPSRILDSMRPTSGGPARPVLRRQLASMLEKRREMDTLGTGTPIDRFSSGFEQSSTKTPPQGRQAEISALEELIQQGEAPLLVGGVGTGRTALFCAWSERGGDGHRLLRVTEATLRLGLREGPDPALQLEDFFEDLSKTEQVLVVFEDIHTLLEGATERLDDPLRRALVAGRFRFAATTDGAGLARLETQEPDLLTRFRPLALPELSVEQTVLVLDDLRGHMESFHDMKISDEALAAAADWAEDYLPSRRLPGAAVDLIDQACAWDILGGMAPREPFLDPDAVYEPNRRLRTEEVAAAVAREGHLRKDWVLASEEERLENLISESNHFSSEMTKAIQEVVQQIQDPATTGCRAVFPMESLSTGDAITLARVLAEHWSGSPARLIELDLVEHEGESGWEDLVGRARKQGPPRRGELATPLRHQKNSVVLIHGFEGADPVVRKKLDSTFESGRLQAPGGEIQLGECVVFFA
ncbi:MAG: Clp protease N-terminal domain-containing protein [Planctomycetota bacterium]|nr:Clp protease N-terminal domain-containing protein [Planctomycetota bacterium]